MKNKKETQRKAKKRRFETEGKGQERKRKIYHVQMSAKIHQDNEIRAPFSAINLQKKTRRRNNVPWSTSDASSFFLFTMDSKRLGVGG